MADEKVNLEEQKVDLATVSINELNLSVRSFNALMYANIRDLSKLIKMSEIDLLKLQNLGRRSVEEIVSKLKMKLTELGYTEEEIKNYRSHVSATQGRTKLVLQIAEDKKKERQEVDFSTISIYSLDLPGRPLNAMARKGIRTLAQILTTSEEELLKFNQMGWISLREAMQKVETKLGELGYTLQEARDLQAQRDAELAKAKLNEKQDIYERFDHEVLDMLRAKPYHEFAKETETYQNIVAIVVSWLERAEKSLLEEAKNENEVDTANKTLDELRTAFKQLVDEKRRMISFDEKKGAARSRNSKANADLEKYHHFKANDHEIKHGYNPFSDDLVR